MYTLLYIWSMYMSQDHLLLAASQRERPGAFPFHRIFRVVASGPESGSTQPEPDCQLKSLY